MKAPLVFIGPSISAREVRELMPEAEVRPPVARDQLYRAREDGYSHFLIVDGAYTQAQAISPREVVDVAKDGATIVGAASMGALRAAECWPAGIYGEGLIYRAYRAGILTRDDEVAVTTDPEREHRAVSVPLVNVRYAAARAAKRGLCSRDTAKKLIAAAETTFYPDRVWSRLFKDAELSPGGAFFEFCQNTSLKKLDAIRGLKKLKSLLGAAPRKEKSRARFSRAHRYDENAQAVSLKRTRPRIKLDLLEWLFGSGRYQAYLWALVAGHVELKRARPEGLREQLPRILRAALADAENFADVVWDELSFLDELDSELMRMYAAERLSREATRASLSPSVELERQTREDLAIAQGTTSWADLRSETAGGYLWGAIPYSWIESAAQKTAASRALSGRHFHAQPIVRLRFG